MVLSRQNIRSRIGVAMEAIATGGYNFGLTAGFRKAINAFAPEEMPETSRHLAYGVVIMESPADDASRLPMGGNFDAVSSVEVTFCFPLRPFSRDNDLNLTYSASKNVLVAISDETNWNVEEARVVPTSAGNFDRLDGDVAVKITLSFDIYHEI